MNQPKRDPFKRLALATGLVACLVVPASAVGKPTQNDRKNAAQECREERGTTDDSRDAFRDEYGTNRNKRNAFGKCVSRRAKDEESERRAARSEAVRECREQHPSGRRRGNAFGKCVSERARQKKAAADRRDRQEIQRRKNAASRA